MKQTKTGSLLEVLVSTVIGYSVALAAQLLVFPLFGWTPPLAANLAIGAIFTVVSIVRGYAVRRLFNRFGWFCHPRVTAADLDAAAVRLKAIAFSGNPRLTLEVSVMEEADRLRQLADTVRPT